MNKRCTKCGESKNCDDFFHFRVGKNTCRDCENTRRRELREAKTQEQITLDVAAYRKALVSEPGLSVPDFMERLKKGRWAAMAPDDVLTEISALDAHTADAQDLQPQDFSDHIASQYDALRPEDFDVGSLNDGQRDAKAGKEKRQEYSRRMGEFAHNLAAGELTERDGAFIAGKAEQELRFQNRKVARSVSLSVAAEALTLRHFKAAATEYLSDKIQPTGYALKPKTRTVKRTVVLFLSDLHLGADLSELDNPLPFRAVQEARRLEFVVRQALEWKPQYREHTELLLLINGDIIEGNLGHDLRDGSPLTEQKVIFWRAFRDILGVLAQAFPTVRVECQPGNHGRDKLRHPGRATSSKWDGHEWQMYFALSQMCTSLPNVKFNVPFRAASLIPLHGATLLLTHGDTELPLAHPDTGAARNFAAIDRANTTRIFGGTFDVAAFGHFHTPRYQPRSPRIIWNGALVPPNGHARASGYIGEPCGQWLWEAVEGHPVGDLRFVGVDHRTDEDEKLGTIVKPFRFT